MELPLIVKRTIAFPPRITVLEISAISSLKVKLTRAADSAVAR